MEEVDFARDASGERHDDYGDEGSENCEADIYGAEEEESSVIELTKKSL